MVPNILHYVHLSEGGREWTVHQLSKRILVMKLISQTDPQQTLYPKDIFNTSTISILKNAKVVNRKICCSENEINWLSHLSNMSLV